MNSRIQRYQFWTASIAASFVLAFSGGEIQAQTDSSCGRQANSRSAQTTQAAKLTLTNQTNETLTVYWLDFEGKRRKWFDLSAGQAFDQSTFVGHLWLVTKPNGQCLAIFSAPGKFALGKPQTPVNKNRPTQPLNKITVQPTSDAAMEKSWIEFFTAFQRAVKQRDKAALKKMISSKWEIMDDEGLVKSTPDQVVNVMDEGEWKALERSFASGVEISKSLKTRRFTADCHHNFDLEADGKWRWVYACFEYLECDCEKPTNLVNSSRPTQLQNQTTPQPNTSTGGGQTRNAVLTVSIQPGAANPLAGAGLALFKQSFGEDLRRKGQVPSGSPAELTPLEFWARSCLTQAVNCRQAMTAMRANSMADIMLDANGSATLPAVPPAAYYVFVMAPAVPPRAWEQSVELKPGANSLTLDPRTMASLDTFLSGGNSASSNTTKTPATNKPANTPPKNPTSGNVKGYTAQGDKYREAKDYANAIDAYKKAIALEPSAYLYNNLGLAYYDLEQFSEAVASFQQSIRIKPDVALYRQNLGEAYLEMGRKEDALQVYQGLQKIDQVKAKAFHKKVEDFFYFEREGKNDKQDVVGAYLAGGLMLRETSLDGALKYFRRVIVLNYDVESVARAYLEIGNVHRERKKNETAADDYRQAVAFYQQTLRLKPTNADAQYHLGITYLALGRRQEARQVYSRLQRLDRKKAQELYAEINKESSQPAGKGGNAASPPAGGGRSPGQRANARSAPPTNARPSRPANAAQPVAAVKTSDQQPRSTPSRCAVVRVTCSDSFEAGMPATFTAGVSGGNPKVTPTFNWAVSAGTIAAGQGTSAVMVDTMGVGMQSVTATVVVGGYARDCDASASCTMSVFKPKPRKFDEYSGPAAERTENLINFEAQLQQDPDAQAYIITYGGRTSRRGEAKAVADTAKDYLVNTRGWEAARIVTVDGGYRGQPSVELWIVPKGASPPEPTPTVDAKDVKPPRKPAAKPRMPPKAKKT